MATTNTDADLQLLFDDSELCKTAETPSFLAPEVIFDFGTETHPPPSSDALSGRFQFCGDTLGGVVSSSAHHQSYRRLGTGCDALLPLFGWTPFRVESNHEFALYGVICTQDWGVEPYMGLDRISTEGRHHNCPNDDPCSEGGEIIELLERLLEKDMSKRITLDEVKVAYLCGVSQPTLELTDIFAAPPPPLSPRTQSVTPFRRSASAGASESLIASRRSYTPCARSVPSALQVAIRTWKTLVCGRLPSISMRRYNSTKEDSSSQARHMARRAAAAQHAA